MKKVLITIAIILVALTLTALCLQSFAPDNAKPSNWFSKDNIQTKKIEFAKLEKDQYIEGLQFDINSTPDLSKFKLDKDDDFVEIMSSCDDYGNERSGLMIGSLNEIMEEIDNDYDEYKDYGRAIAFDDYIIYSEQQLSYNGFGIPKGWNTYLLDENGVFRFEKFDEDTLFVKVKQIHNSDLWNGVFAGAVVPENKPEGKLCWHSSTDNGICSYCGKVVYLRYEIDRVEGLPEKVLQGSDLSILSDVKVYLKSNAGDVLVFSYPDIEFESFDTSELGYYHNCYISVNKVDCWNSYYYLYEVIAEEVSNVDIFDAISFETINQYSSWNSELTLYVRYNTGRSEYVNVTENMVTNFSTDEIGSFTCCINYKGYKIDFPYQVLPVFEPVIIDLDKTISINASSFDNLEHMASVYFTPSESGEYVFSSKCEYDSLGYLFDDNNNQIAWDDDSGEDMGFKIIINLEANKTYRLFVKTTDVSTFVELTVKQVA